MFEVERLSAEFSEELDLTGRRRLKKAVTRNKKFIGCFKVTFLIGLTQREYLTMTAQVDWAPFY
jgi:hypothetical protein